MKMVWYPRTLGQQPMIVDVTPWTRMEKLTAVAIALGAFGTLWSVYTWSKKR
jgi:hypothetical protein